MDRSIGQVKREIPNFHNSKCYSRKSFETLTPAQLMDHVGTEFRMIYVPTKLWHIEPLSVNDFAAKDRSIFMTGT